jgi:serine/threonine-protein kinase SRPK3
MNRYVALKIVKSAEHYTETADDEIKLLQRVIDANPADSGRFHIVELLDQFRHSGPHGMRACFLWWTKLTTRCVYGV